MGSYTANNYFYKPDLGANGLTEKETFDAALDAADSQIAENKTNIGENTNNINTIQSTMLKKDGSVSLTSNWDVDGAGTLYIDKTNGNVGIGTTSPLAKLEIYSGNLKLEETNYSRKYGVIYKGNNPFIHDFNYGDNGTVTTAGNNIFIGKNTGNFTMGGSATAVWHSSYNTIIGPNSFGANTTGYENVGVGEEVLLANTSGYRNVAVGRLALKANTIGGQNIAIGMYALAGITDTSRNIGIGMNAGRHLSDGLTDNNSSNSIYIGEDTKASGAGVSNEIVIGYNAVGNGSNTITLGNTSVTKTILQGNVGIGTTSPTQKLEVKGVLNLSADVTIGEVQFFDGNVGVFRSNGTKGQGGNTLTIGAYDDIIFTASANSLGSQIERMRIDSSTGNVGIGTTSPTQKLDINSDVLRLRTAKTPSSASDTGNAGDICWDSNYIYVCVATDTWKRVSLNSW